MTSLTDEAIEQAVMRLRTKLGIADQPCPDMITVLFKVQHIGLIAGYRRVPDEQMPNSYASFDPDARILSVRESTFVAANDVLLRRPQRQRARFTLAHELGHAELGHMRMRNRSMTALRIEQIALTIKRDESEADRFAGAFLVPFHLVGNPAEWTPPRIAEHFDVSAMAAEIRLIDIQRMYRRANDIVKPLPPSVVRLLEEGRARGVPVRSLDVDERLRRNSGRPDNGET